MSDTEGTVTLEAFLEFLKTLAWCKQEPDVLVAVHKLTPEVIEVMREFGASVFPGGVHMKLNKSFLHDLQNKFDDGQPLPAVLVWKPQQVEIWYRRHNASDFPYDTWTNPVAAAHEKERVLVPCEKLGPTSLQSQSELAARSKACPSMIPPH